MLGIGENVGLWYDKVYLLGEVYCSIFRRVWQISLMWIGKFMICSSE